MVIIQRYARINQSSRLFHAKPTHAFLHYAAALTRTCPGRTTAKRPCRGALHLNQEGKPPMPDNEEIRDEDRTCQCYCIRAWGAPLPNPDVVSSSTVGTWLKTQTETETGEVFRTATVTEKTYLCATKKVTGSRDINASLARHIYTQTRTRILGVSVTVKRVLGIPIPIKMGFFWGPWSAWTRANGPNYTEKRGLASASPPFLPWCQDEGIPCP